MGAKFSVAVVLRCAHRRALIAHVGGGGKAVVGAREAHMSVSWEEMGLISS